MGKRMRKFLGMTLCFVVVSASLLFGGVKTSAATELLPTPFFKVFEYQTLHEGEVEVGYWVDNIVKGNTERFEFFGTPKDHFDKDGLWRHSFMLAYGVTDKLTLEYFADFFQPGGSATKYVQSRGVVRYRFFEPGERFFDTAIYVEYFVPRHDYRKTNRVNVRLILEKNVGPVKITLNPILNKNTSNTDAGGVTDGVEFEYATGFYFTSMKRVTPGVEFFGSLGEISQFRQQRDQLHYIFPSAKIMLPGHVMVDTGVGFGLTPHSDDIIVKALFTYEFDTAGGSGGHH